MLGLLTKDFRLMFSRKTFFAMVLLIGLMLSFSGNSFVVAYLTMLCALFTASTISYDEYDNCFAFLMTMPIDAKIYSLEKYVFGISTSVIAWLVGTGAFYVSSMVRGMDFTSQDMVQLVAYIPIFLWMIAIVVPLQLKFGAEKSRLVMVAGMAFGMVAFSCISDISDSVGVDTNVVLQKIASIPDQTFAVSTMLLTVIVVVVSCCFSINIMKKKEY